MRILIAEDDSLYRDLYTAVLAAWPDLKVCFAEDGQQAWSRLDDPRQCFDVVFLDLELPVLNGLEVLKRVRAYSVHRTVPIIVCTAYNDRSSVLRAIGLGADDYLTKPVTEAKIAPKLHRASELRNYPRRHQR